MSAPTLPVPDLRDGRPPTLRADAADPRGWFAWAAHGIHAALREHGGVLVRGLGVASPTDLAALLPSVATRPAEEREAFAPRTPLVPGVHSATVWPAAQQMCAHHELSYAVEFPGLLAFACLTPPETGGTTGVADGAAVLADLPADLVARAERVGWALHRSYSAEIGASWQQAFGTDDPAAVDAFCRTAGIETDWHPEGLRTRQRRPAVVRHPVTGVRVWFNQIAFLSEWTMDPDVREFLVDCYGADGLPFATRFGDGAEIGEEVVAAIGEVYTRHTVTEPWEAGDLLLVDNVRSAHSREAYTGPREVVVGLADPVRLTDCLRGGAA
ncbi:TauD/TfdA family dioxygenase [Pseudonocardia xishanensis]|uniref:TauD/TfdA family dioxygenase n=1 Tax=Pseudonocardia xishanensis TaxID=630995 RepID=A0ABP8RPY8_9PSEU